ncbi:helix-turn-helix domain-containing protein [Anabaena azotica]|uniref:helix-turn-helix domain-containing protein n=1 Tax=Anabaena azotica TaxID=197653 RepID=UPI0039A63816
MTVLNDAQQEQLKEITANLRQVREEKNISLEAISIQTHIRLSFLQALEEWRFEDLPEPVFVKGFIRRYADRLELDGTAIANSLEINFAPLESNPSNRKPSIYIPLFVPYIFLLIAAAVGLFYLLKIDFRDKSLANKQNPILSVEQKTLKSPLNSEILPSPNTAPVSAATPSPISTPVSDVAVTLELKGDSWVQIKADGKTEFEGILTKGERKNWTAKKSLTVRSGNAGVVLISVNEEEPKLLGKNGQVKDFTYKNQ